MSRPLRATVTAKAMRPRWWIPPPIEAWFRGERDRPLTARVVPFCGLLDEYWAAWRDANPGSKRPKDFPAMSISAGEKSAALKYLTRNRPKWFGRDAQPRNAGRE